MATYTRTVLRVASGCRRHLTAACPTYTGVSQPTPWHLPVRTVKVWQKDKKKDEKVKEVKKDRPVIDDSLRHKPLGLTAWAPVDDVYLTRYYPKPTYGAAEAIGLLKTYQQLDRTPSDQSVFINLKLDMKLEKKRKVDPFVSTVQLPHPFKTEANKIAVFTENPDQVKLALECGAAFVGGADLMQRILDDEVEADYYVAVPDIVAKLVPLRNKLRKKFPKSKRGSVNESIPKMMELFRMGHEYLVEKERYVITTVGSLDMPQEHLLANIQTVVVDVCSYKPASFGKFIERAIINSQTSEALLMRTEELVPQEEEEPELVKQTA